MPFVFKQLMQLTDFFFKYYHSTEPRLFIEGCGFGSRGTPGDCDSWKMFPCQSSCFHSGLTIIIHIPLPPAVTQEQLDRAKEATKSAVLMNLESRVHCSCSWSNPNCMTCFPKVFFTLHTFPLLQSIASEDIGRQVLTYGERYGSIAMLVHKLNLFSAIFMYHVLQKYWYSHARRFSVI
jgi:hypothetical protein